MSCKMIANYQGFVEMAIHRIYERVLHSHAEFVNNIIEHMKNDSLSEKIAKDAADCHLCQIGVWLDAIEPIVGYSEDYKAVYATHADFHNKMSSIVKAYYSGQIIFAIDSLEKIHSINGGAFCDILEALTRFLIKADREVIERF
jgi:hypothetical protein